MNTQPETTTRRDFVTGLAAVLAAGAAATLAAPLQSAEEAAPARERVNTDLNAVGLRYNWGMAIDLDTCTNCGACVVACRTENNVPCSTPDPKLQGTEIYWMDILPRKEFNSKDETLDLMPTPCLHCENAACVKVCPVNATYISDEGIVAQIWDRCIGCRYCQTACPYTRRTFNWVEPNWPESYRQSLNPDVATRPIGVVEKCTLCYHKIRKVREQGAMEQRTIKDEEVEYLPACASACPAKAIIFGDMNDPDSRVSRLNKSSRAFHLLEYLGTKPKVFYLGKDRRVEG